MSDIQPLDPITTTTTTTAAPAQSIVSRLIPDRRDWFLIGSFVIVGYLLLMVQANPKLLAVASFMQLATALVGLLILIGNNLFGGTKSGTETAAATNAAIVKQATVTAPPDSTTVTQTKTVEP